MEKAPPEPAPRASARGRECAGAHVCGRVFAPDVVARPASLSRRGRAWSGASGVGGGTGLGWARAFPVEASAPDARPVVGGTRLGHAGGLLVEDTGFLTVLLPEALGQSPVGFRSVSAVC